MKITVIGGSSRTGLEIIGQAIRAGHFVTAVARTPSKVTAAADPNLEVVAADICDPAALQPLFAGRDAVLFSLGHNDRRPSSIMRDAMEATIWAMSRAGTRRLVAISASGFVRDRNDSFLLRRVAKPLVGRILKESFRDMQDMEQEMVASDLEWTIVSPPRLLARPFDGRYRTSADLTVRGGSTISRADLADYLLRAASDPATVGHRMFVAK